MPWRPFQRKRAPLTGAPPIRRLKTYSAQSGYVYQYYYLGHRDYRQTGIEYAFDVSSDRKTSHEVSVIVLHDAVASWEANSKRALASNERYAIAKLALFQAFDERPEPAQMSKEIFCRTADVATILETLGIE